MGFIHINLNDIINGGEFHPITLDYVGQALQKRVKLDPPQMEMFTDLDVTKLPDGTIWLDFLSSKYAPNKIVMDFMAYCYQQWGADSHGRGMPSEADVPRLKDGSFGRTWENVKLLQIKRPEHLSLSIALRIIIDNEDMSNFINQLAKGFVRSAVNQVGRDGGKVVSNTIYNNKNYTPIVDVTHQTTPQNQTTEQFQPSIPPEAYSTTKPLSTGKIILFTVLSLFLFPIGNIGVLIYGIAKICDYSDKLEWIESSPRYVIDRRYKSNMRYDGETRNKRTMLVKASTTTRAINKRNGIIAISISLITGIIIGGALIIS